ncbi:hypothetical protein K443DRAFT_11748 [Laccaria amethystina LaAM-08-1]|uniref:Uncharacterized protein n=1 Tax=Laccaria amethystina LaAM-08-1 TaxID=1095629 RepID=A0A0C9X0W8_9AGAR|nr:hypothetical protein K443DRAFT_11748 [Laccaria amethystina LaAM-08-1]
MPNSGLSQPSHLEAEFQRPEQQWEMTSGPSYLTNGTKTCKWKSTVPLKFRKSGASSKKTWYILVPPTPYNTGHSQLEITPESPLTGLNASAGASVGPLNVLPIAQPTLGQKQGTVDPTKEEVSDCEEYGVSSPHRRTGLNMQEPPTQIPPDHAA